MSPLSTPSSPGCAVAPDHGAVARAPSEDWDALVALASELTGCPLALLSLSEPALVGAGIGLSARHARCSRTWRA